MFISFGGFEICHWRSARLASLCSRAAGRVHGRRARATPFYHPEEATNTKDVFQLPTTPKASQTCHPRSSIFHRHILSHTTRALPNHVL